ncbi:MAG: glycosyltransferase family 9 protein [Candidatus Omnitrophica bacterium]|nr:glycosyltransferase family 9 protein [Candidatus Omnitrophota bacterium]
MREDIYRRLQFFYFRYILRLFKLLKKRPRFLFDLSDAGVGIGNIICVTPAIAALRGLYPQSIIDVKLIYGELLEDWKIVDEIYDSKTTEEAYDAVFRYHFGKDSRKINTIKLDVVIDKNEARYHFEKIQRMGYKGAMPPLYVSVKPLDMPFPKDRLKIGIVNCGKDVNFGLNGESKSWPHYDELIMNLLENYRCRIYFIGGADEKGKMKVSGDHIVDCVGQYNLAQTAFILKSCDIVIGNDCGPMRIADAVGVRHYVIWGPTSRNKNAYLNNFVDIYNKNVTCRPCQGRNKRERCGHLACLTDLKPVDVIKAIHELKYWQK